MLNVYRMILSLLDKREKKRLALLLCLVVVTGLLEMVGVASILPLLQVIADPGMVETNRFLAGLYGWFGFESIRSFQIFLGAGAFCVVTFGLGFRALTTYALNRFTVMRSYRFSLRLLQGYLHQPYVWFLNRHSAILRNAVLAEVEKMVSGVMMPAMLLLPALLSAVLIITLIFVLEPLVAIGALVVLGGAYGLIFLALRNILTQLGQKRLAASQARARVVQEATGGLKELKLMGLEGGFTTRFEREARKLARINSVTLVMKQMPRFALEGLAFGGMILMILFLLLRGDGDLAEVLPTLGVVAIAALRLFPALQGIYGSIATIRFNKATMESVHGDLMALDPQGLAKRAVAEKIAPIRLQQALELRDVSYAYPETDRSALDRLSLTIPANTTVGIVGSTGAGKTTVVDLMLGLLRPQSGALIVDGQEITDDLLRAWQKSVGYVPQQIYLTATSVAANIAFGVPRDQIDMAAVERAARVAALHDFVQEQLPQGYDTIIGEQGVRLSGGQRQRVGIARALYRDPEILIMDEATSALDNLTEQAVMEAVHNLAGAKTVVMIAHRLTTVAPCDTIFLMEQGRLVAQGSYEELIASNLSFRRMAGTG